MPPKRKIKKKKKRSTKKSTKSDALGSLNAGIVIPEYVPRYATLHCRLVNWVFMDFALVDVDVGKTRLFTIKRKIKQRHGKINDLKVYHGTIQPQSELKDDMKTLEELGIVGSPIEDKPGESFAGQESKGTPGTAKRKEVTIWYDFKPDDHGDPLLLKSPRGVGAN